MFVEEVLRREGLDVRLSLGMMPGPLHNKTCLVVAIGKAAPPVREFYDRNGAAIIHQVDDRPRTARVDDGDGLGADHDALHGDGGESRPELLDEGA